MQNADFEFIGQVCKYCFCRGANISKSWFKFVKSLFLVQIHISISWSQVFKSCFFSGANISNFILEVWFLNLASTLVQIFLYLASGLQIPPCGHWSLLSTNSLCGNEWLSLSVHPLCPLLVCPLNIHWRNYKTSWCHC